MKNILAIAQKEVKTYFISPIAYVVLTIFFVIYGFLTFNILSYFNLQCMQYRQYNQGFPEFSISQFVLEPSLHNMGFIFLLIAPFLTMRLFAEESKGKTMDLLLTSPLYLFEIILGKFLSVAFFLIILLLITFYFPATLFVIANPELPPLFSGYLGIFLMGSAFLSIGIFASSLTENQIIAAVITFGILLFFWIVGWASHMVGEPWSTVLKYLSFIEHNERFISGLIDTRDIVYYLSITVFGLFLSHRVLESRRWR
ncbi:MAG: ABC transporter permease [Thermodesulfobacteriota bacterium]|nr:ABC transporter permease [Thermodesulfobacteriota bacterium]